MSEILPVPLSEATDRQILLAVSRNQATLMSLVEELTLRMADLEAAVGNLTTAVQGVADRVNAALEPLRTALSAAQQQLTDFQAADATEDADYQNQISTLGTNLQSELDKASAAADQINAEVDSLNQIAAAPVQPEPQPEPPVEP